MAKKKEAKPVDTGIKRRKRDGEGGVPWVSAIFLTIFVTCAAIASAYSISKIRPVELKLRSPTPIYGRMTTVSEIEKLLEGNVTGPAAFAFKSDDSQELYTGLADGRIIKVFLENGTFEEVLATGRPGDLNKAYSCGSYYTERICGRPLGMAFDNDGLRLFVADPYAGLLSIDVEDKRKEILSEAVMEDDELNYINDIVVSKHTGIVFFTETSTVHNRNDHNREFLEGNGTGRLLAYDPTDGSTYVLTDNLYAPTGLVILSSKDGKDDQYVLIAESNRARIRRFHLPKQFRKYGDLEKGKSDSFAKGLPGFPEHMVWSEDGKELLVACGSGRTSWSFMDVIVGFPALRQAATELPDVVYKALFYREPIVLRYSLKGKFLGAVSGFDSVPSFMGVYKHGGYQYYASLDSNFIARSKQ